MEDKVAFPPAPAPAIAPTAPCFFLPSSAASSNDDAVEPSLTGDAGFAELMEQDASSNGDVSDLNLSSDAEFAELLEQEASSSSSEYETAPEEPQEKLTTPVDMTKSYRIIYLPDGGGHLEPLFKGDGSETAERIIEWQKESSTLICGKDFSTGEGRTYWAADGPPE